MFINSATLLATVIGTQILVNDKEKAIRKWLGGEVNITRQKQLNHNRIDKSGQWILESAEYKGWVGDKPSTLICSGIGIYYLVYVCVNYV